MLGRTVLTCGLVWASLSSVGWSQDRKISPPNDLMFQFPKPQPKPKLVEASALVRAPLARQQFLVDGAGLTAVVMDTGLRTTHVDFAGKVLAERNYTSDNGGNPNNADDGDGHGTNVAGIVCANGIHVGIAPGANVIPVKVLSNTGGGSFNSVVRGLDWVLANRTFYNISVVNMSLGDSGNYSDDTPFTNDTVRQRIIQCRQANIAVVIAAGNSFFSWNSQEGMGFPGICREGISVGAFYDANVGSFSYGDGATAFTTGPSRITPFSQRLHQTTNPFTRTDIFAPGAPLTSSGILNDTAESTMHGTSQATPVTAGLVLLAQQYWLARKGSLPTVDQLEKWLRASKFLNVDGDDEDDNVTNTGKTFISADAIELLTAVKNDITPPPPPVVSSNVVAVYSAGTKTLTLTGDTKSNAVSISLKGGKLKVEGSRGTRVNNSSSLFSVSHSGKLTLNANLSAGDDSISVIGVEAAKIDLILGTGADKAAITYSKVDLLNVDGGTGTDSLVTTTSKVTTKNVTSVP